MIEISFGKLVVLALIALIVLGPEKLPGAARTAGALLRRVRSGWDSVRTEVERELQVEEIKRAAREAAARAQAAQDELNRTMGQVRGNFSDAPAGTPPEARAIPAGPAPGEAPPPAAMPEAEAAAPAHDKEPPHGAA
jgi:sec-independent protein translocase protein TatB